MRNLFCSPTVPLNIKVMFSASVKAIIRSYQPHADGTCDVMIQVIIDRKKTKINTGIRWPVEYWDSGQGFCLKRNGRDSLASDNNIEIRRALARANDIFFFYRTALKMLTLDQFKIDYLNYYNRADFLAFMEAQIAKQVKLGMIEVSTGRNHTRTLKLLKQFKPNLEMIDLVKTLPKEFEAWMRKYHTKNANTRRLHHKNFRTYINRAIDEGYERIPKIYKGFQMHEVPAKDRALLTDELLSVVKYYRTCIEPPRRRVLRRFLFSCFSGLRISDLSRVEPSWLYDKKLVFVPHKTRNAKSEVFQVPLSETALALFKEEVKEATAKGMFRYPTPQAGNRLLVKIGQELGIGTRLTSKTGRKTCATMVVNQSGDLHAAQKYLNHSDIRTTMGYDHVDDRRKEKASMVIENLLGGLMKSNKPSEN